jgi:hypothetical protein
MDDSRFFCAVKIVIIPKQITMWYLFFEKNRHTQLSCQLFGRLLIVNR